MECTNCEALKRMKEIYLSSKLKDYERRQKLFDECVKMWQKELSPEEQKKRQELE